MVAHRVQRRNGLHPWNFTCRQLKLLLQPQRPGCPLLSPTLNNNFIHAKSPPDQSACGHKPSANKQGQYQKRRQDAYRKAVIWDQKEHPQWEPRQDEDITHLAIVPGYQNTQAIVGMLDGNTAAQMVKSEHMGFASLD
jgi:hypothetical protein